MALDAYALTTLARFQAYRKPNTTTGAISGTLDSYYNDLINNSSAMIESYLGRKIKQRRFREWYGPPSNGQTWVLRNAPVNYVYGCYSSGAIGFTAQFTTSGAIAAGIDLTQDRAVLTSVTTAGVETVTTTLTYASYPSISTLVTAINLVSGWSATLVSDAPSYRLFPSTYEALSSYVANVYYAWRRFRAAVINPDAGRVQLVNYETQIDPVNYDHDPYQYQVDYDAGWASVPYEIEQACWEIGTEMDRSIGTTKEAGADLPAAVRRAYARIEQYRFLSAG